MPSAILLTHCPDQPGLVRAVASFIAENGGNIIQFDQHVDTQAGIFFMRAEWDLENFVIPRTDLPVFIRALAEPRRMTWSLHFSDQRHRLALFVSKDAHCLYDLLSRHEAGELEADIPLIVANHETLRPAAERFGIPFHVVVRPPEGGLTSASGLLCDAVRSVSKDRLLTRWGSVLPATMATVEDRLRVLMGL